MDQKQFEAMLGDAETRLRRLRTLYDQWFQGIERTEPRTPKVEIDRIINLLRASPPRNTALRFRMNQLVQRYVTYNTHWQRIGRQIEEGTYKRDVLRAKKRFAKVAGQEEAGFSDGYDLDIDIDLDHQVDAVTLVTRAPQVPVSKAPQPPPPPSPKEPAAMPPTRTFVRAKVASEPPPNGLPDEQIARIYQRYLDARRQNSERTDNIKVESIAKTVREMMPKLIQKHAGKRIDFDVVMKDGKVALKPVAK